MAIESRDILKTYFETGNIPTEQDFANLIDSYIHRIDDGVYIFDVPASTDKRFGVGIQQPVYPLGIKASGATQALISLHDLNNAARWLINMMPSGAVDHGLNIGQQTVAGIESRLFINSATGNIGLGTLEPEELLQLEKSTASDVTGLKILNTASVGNQGWKMGHLQDALEQRDGALVFIEGAVANEERLIIIPGGNVGINEALPDTKLHVSRAASDPGAVISLVEGTGIVVIGPITDNLVFDFEGIQARHGEYIGPVLELQTTALNLQPLGGDVIIHSDDTLEPEQKIIFTNDGLVGLGTLTPLEKLDVGGAVKIGTTTNTNSGTIRFTGTDFEGRKDAGWVSLTAGNGPWSIGAGDTIYYNNGSKPSVGIGLTAPQATLGVSSKGAVIQADTAAIISNTSATSSTGQDDNRIALLLQCAGSWSSEPLAKNIGLYISEVSGQVANEANLAAVMNGNVVIGDLLAGSDIIGDAGSRVLAIQNGTAPTGFPTADSVQLYSQDNALGTPILNIMTGNGDVIKIYKEAALTPADASAFSGTYDGSVIDILNNMRNRINELESKLQAIGLLA